MSMRVFIRNYGRTRCRDCARMSTLDIDDEGKKKVIAITSP